jgi:glycerol uptake facilitator-like aquaporin
MAKFSRKGYFQPTPKKLRIIGDTLLTTFGGTTLAVVLDALTEEDKSIRNTKLIFGIVSLALGMTGKILTNFYTNEPVKKDEDENSETE